MKQTAHLLLGCSIDADAFAQFWPHFVAVADVLISLVASAHVVLYKRDARAAIAWVGLIWLAPLVGTALYVWLGINRIKRRAQFLRATSFSSATPDSQLPCDAPSLREHFGNDCANLETLAQLVGRLTQRPLLAGNQVTTLVGGDAAYPAMLGAIAHATHSIALSTYIFDNDRAGRRFSGALADAITRDVEVRVLIDDVGARYTWPSMVRRLHKAQIPVARFLPTLVPRRFWYSNMRNHRKLLVVDGRTGFTGGMNIREGHAREFQTRHRIDDVHFRIDGPAVAALREVFAADWAFCTQQLLEGDAWFPPLPECGPVLARGITDGPDEDLDKLRLILLGALAAARSSVLVVTPYFVPDQALTTALSVAALRGVDVDIVLPRKNNLALVGWASVAQLWQVLEHGCRVWQTPPPFDHSKLMIVDGTWTLLGTANWDTRSLRLNFEFNVECYDRDLAASLTELVQAKIAAAKPVSLADVNGRSLPVKLRDGVARLFSPYL